jgi:predicted RNA-binding Zn-ribbon protein involved in translation (DUF1610 family)
MGSNREKARKQKSGRFWCTHCDRDYIGKGQKCRHCGNIEQKRNKK